MKFEILKFGDCYSVRYVDVKTYGRPMWLSRKLTLFYDRTSSSTLEFSSEAAAIEVCKRYKEQCDEIVRNSTGQLVRQIEL